MTTRIDRRGVLAGAAAFGSLGALGIPAARAQDARIRLLWWGSQNRNERTAAVIDLFTGANPGVAVEGESAGWDAYWARLATQTAGGNAPDVMQMDYRYIFEYARRGVLLALDDAMADGALDLSGFSQEAIAGGQVDGKTYGVSLGANSSTMIVSQAAFEEAGVALPEKGITWDDFAARAAELTEKAGKRGFYGSADAGGLEPTFEGWLRQRGKALYDAESKLGFDAEDATAWFAMWQAMRESGACVPADLQALDQLNIETSMVSLGHAGVSFAHSNQIVGYQGMSQTPLVMVPYPIGGPDSKPGQYLKPSMFFSLSANSGVPAEAAGFVSFFVNDPAATDAAIRDGWFHSGDAAVVHPDGYVAIRDRFKDVIISGGENISSVEVEGCLLRHPAVQEAAVVGMPHEKWGESPHAFVILRAGASATEDELKKHVRDNLAHFKTPQWVSFVTELPKTATGKVQKYVLRAGKSAIARQ